MDSYWWCEAMKKIVSLESHKAKTQQHFPINYTIDMFVRAILKKVNSAKELESELDKLYEFAETCVMQNDEAILLVVIGIIDKLNYEPLSLVNKDRQHAISQNSSH